MDDVAGRLEIGVKLSFATVAGAKRAGALLRSIKALLLTEVDVRDGKGYRRQPLASIGRALAAHYLRSSSATSELADAQPWWIAVGGPMILCEFRDPVEVPLPIHVTHVLSLDLESLDLSHCLVQLGDATITTWLLRPAGGIGQDALRRIRLNLVRIYEESEATRLLLRLIAAKRLAFEGDASDRLQEFFNRVIGVLESKSRFGIEQAPLLAVARDVNATVHASERELLLQSISTVRRQVRQKIERQVAATRHAHVVNVIDNVERIVMTKITFGDNVAISGDFTVATAETIQNSFNRVASSSVGKDLKEALEELSKQVATLAKQLPPDKAEEVSRDLENLAKEATSATPRKKWYELSADGLIEAAKAVAGMVDPVSVAVRSVLTLLA